MTNEVSDETVGRVGRTGEKNEKQAKHEQDAKDEQDEQDAKGSAQEAGAANGVRQAGTGVGARREAGPWRGWREATEQALYGPGGFYSRAQGPGPAGHFRTSVHASPLFARAVATLLLRVDEALGHPAELALVDVGAGRAELLTAVLDALADARHRALPDSLPEPLPDPLTDVPAAPGAQGSAHPDSVRARLRPYAIERAPRPEGLDPRVAWLSELPEPGSLTGLLFANEWLDNVPVEIAECGPGGGPHYVLVAPDGSERLGTPVRGEDAAWLARWWPLPAEPGRRAEIGRPRDAAWSRAVRTLRAGLAVTADYAHHRGNRPPYGTLTGFRDGREVRPVPDGSCDITAHVALDACAGPRSALLTQRAALHELGVDGRRPPLALASSDPAGYVRALSRAGQAAELTDPAGLGGFTWLVQPVGVGCEGLLEA